MRKPEQGVDGNPLAYLHSAVATPPLVGAISIYYFFQIDCAVLVVPKCPAYKDMKHNMEAGTGAAAAKWRRSRHRCVDRKGSSIVKGCSRETVHG
jgi:hypothetical protein